MLLFQNKYITTLVLSLFLLASCSTKKQVFTGTETLNCPNYSEDKKKHKTSKKTKWRLVLYKDGKKVGKKSRRGKSKLFKHKD